MQKPKTNSPLQDIKLLLQKLNEAIPAADSNGYQHNLTLDPDTGSLVLILATAAGGLALEFEPGDFDKNVEELVAMIVDAYALSLVKKV